MSSHKHVRSRAEQFFSGIISQRQAGLRMLKAYDSIETRPFTKTINMVS